MGLRRIFSLVFVSIFSIFTFSGCSLFGGVPKDSVSMMQAYISNMESKKTCRVDVNMDLSMSVLDDNESAVAHIPFGLAGSFALKNNELSHGTFSVNADISEFSNLVDSDSDKKESFVKDYSFYTSRNDSTYTLYAGVKPDGKSSMIWQKSTSSDGTSYVSLLSLFGHMFYSDSLYKDMSFAKENGFFVISCPVKTLLENDFSSAVLTSFFDQINSICTAGTTKDMLDSLKESTVSYIFDTSTKLLHSIRLKATDAVMSEPSLSSVGASSISYDFDLAFTFCEYDNISDGEFKIPDEVSGAAVSSDDYTLFPDDSDILGSVYDVKSLAESNADTSSEEMLHTGDIRSGVFGFNGIECSMPLLFKNLSKDGWTLSEEGILSSKMSSDDWVSVKNAKYKGTVLNVILNNPTVNDIAYSEANIISMDLSVKDKTSKFPSIVLPCGIKWFSSVEDINMKYGTPDYQTDLTDSVKYRYDMPNNSGCIELYIDNFIGLKGISYQAYM